MDFEIKPVRVDRPTPSEDAKFKQPWVPYPEGAEALKFMKGLIGRPHEGRPLNLAIIGEPNFGKSHLLDYFIDCYPDLPDENPPRAQVLAAEVPPKADGTTLVRELIKQTGTSFNPRWPLDELLDRFCIRAAALRVHLFILDEFHNANWGRRDAALTMLQSVRAISNRLRRPIVIAGTSDVENVLANDPQLDERFCRLRLPSWDNEEQLGKFLIAFEATLGMPQLSMLYEDKKMAELLARSGTRLGRIVTLVREARAIALNKHAESIELTHIQAAAELLKRPKPAEAAA